jgi:hypothetical protein
VGWPSFGVVFGGVLLSHTVSGAVPSALKGLTSGFGMGPGVSRFAMAAVTSLFLCFGGGSFFQNCTVDASAFFVLWSSRSAY